MKIHEIWIGNYHMGQGSSAPNKPELVASMQATTFEIACLKYELKSKLDWLNKADLKGDYISKQDFEWFYKPSSNSNSWTGKYYETQSKAQQSFL